MFSRSLTVFSLAVSCLMAQEPRDSRDWLNRGVAAFKGGRYPEATQAFAKAVDLDPANPTARLYLATAYLQQFIPGAESDENRQTARNALEQFQKVLELQPENTVAMGSIASLYLNQKKWDDAQQWYQKLTAVDANNAEAYYSLGFIAWSRWYPAYAQARVSAGMRPEDPGPMPLVPAREELKAKYGQAIEDGLRALDRAIEIDPAYSDAMAYENLLIRERAELRDTPEEYRRDIAVADQWLQKALDAKRAKADGAPGGGKGDWTAAPPPPPPPPPASAPAGQAAEAPMRIRVGSNVEQANLVSQVPPVYPELAKQARIQGTVSLSAVIGKDGRVAELKVLKGHPLMIQAAMDAVRQWVYRPTLLNGAPVEVATTIEVTFTLPN
ncbi:MAG: TonB family protein [Acidobacteriia bacterium]|nr:TonB family protein [Terriglobia bacterium]